MQAGFWLILFVVLLVIEICTLGLTTVWFAGGALVAWVLALLKVSLPIQVIVFLIISIALLVLTRPIVMKQFNRKREQTNAERLIGQIAVVTEQIDNIHATGVVIVGGLEWSARTKEPDVIIEKDKIVIVEEIQGVKLIVKEKEA